MSKLEEQKALPRRKLFKIVGVTDPRDAGWDGATLRVIEKPNRKAKKAKGKR